MYRIWSHAAQPGPEYWDFKCLACDEDVDQHAPWILISLNMLSLENICYFAGLAMLILSGVFFLFNIWWDIPLFIFGLWLATVYK